jgi:hypothetical protein
MTTTIYSLLFASIISHFSAAFGATMVERRIWIEHASKEIEDDQCGEKQKQWRCVFPEKNDCIREMREAGKYCRVQVVPDLPEYVDGEEGLATAKKVVIECLALKFSEKHLVGMPQDKLAAYNECTGVTPRSKPLSVGLQKALDFSKTQTNFTCASDGYIRKCFGYSEADCKSLVAKSQQDCTMRMEAEGKKVKDEEPAIQEGGKKITECALADARDSAGKTHKKTNAKGCN